MPFVNLNDTQFQYKYSFLNVLLLDSLRKTLLSPLERYKLIKQTQLSYISRDAIPINNFIDYLKLSQQIGYRSFFRGNLTFIIQGVFKFEMNYLFYENIKQLLASVSDTNNMLTKTTAAIGCGFLTSLVLHPLEIIRMKQATELSPNRQYMGILSTKSAITTSEMSKPSPMYRGLIINNVTNIPFTVSLLLMLDILNASQNSNDMNQLYMLQAANLTAGLIVYPLDTVKRRMMTASTQVWGNICTSSHKMASYIVSKEGVGSLYQGVSPFVVKNLVMVQLQYLIIKNGLYFQKKGQQE